MAFMLASCSLKLAAFVTMTGMMTVSEDLVSVCKNDDSFDEGKEELLFE